jgi:arylsulfatase A-like enzyme/HEAT repeat protein
MRSVARGAYLGAATGVIVALGDMAATMGTLGGAAGRARLLAHLLATVIPVGAFVGATCVGLGGWADRRLRGLLDGHGSRLQDERRHRWWWPLPWMLAVAAPLAWMTHLLLGGGAASRLPHQGLLRALIFGLLLAAAYAVLRGGRALHDRLRGATRVQGLGAGLLLLLAHHLLASLNRHAYPGLYDYLHALLAAVAALVAALGLAVIAAHVPSLRSMQNRRRPAVILLGAAAVAFAFNLFSLGSSHGVRVALFDARAATARPLMRALTPAFAAVSPPPVASHFIVPRLPKPRPPSSDGMLPVLPDAHVLLITVDALRADHLGAHGYDREITPQLDALASRSVLFERAYAAAPHSSHSLCSAMASEFVRERLLTGAPLPEATLASVLSEHGYLTVAYYTNGIFHTDGESLQDFRERSLGFATHDPSNRSAEARTDQLIAEIDRLAAAGEPPSLLWVHYFDPHEPYRERSLGDSPVDRYDGEIRNVDTAVGRLLREVDARLERDVIVVLTADHGEEFRDHGGLYHGFTLYDEQVRVPWMILAPGVPPRRVGGQVSTVDLAPTLLGLLGVPAAETMRGRDLRPAMLGWEDQPPPIFASVGHKRMVVQWPHKLIADLRYGLLELYDLDADPSERRNRADALPDRRDALLGQIHGWLDALRTAPGAREQAESPHQAALARGRMLDRRAVAPLAQLVRDPEAPLGQRREAAWLLGTLGDRSAAGALAHALDDTDSQLAAEAAVALGMLRDPAAAAALEALSPDPSTDLGMRAAVALGRLGDADAVPGLIAAARSGPTRRLRHEAIRLLGSLGDHRAVRPLLDLLPDLRVRRQAIAALGTLGDPAARLPLEDLIRWEHRPTVRDAAVQALGEIGDPRSVDVLRPLVHDAELRNVNEALRRLGASTEAQADGPHAQASPAPSASARARASTMLSSMEQ